MGKTLLPWELRQGWHACVAHWRRVTVSGTVQWCFSTSASCTSWSLVKFTSPCGNKASPSTPSLRLPICTLDFWQPQHLPFLQVMNYLALVVEPLIPDVTAVPPGHPGKWCGLLCQLGFSSGHSPDPAAFVNLGLLGTSVLFFRAESGSGCGGVKPIRYPAPDPPPQSCRVAGAGLCWCSVWQWRVAPSTWGLHQPAYACLWVVGIAQEYHLFDWIDKMNHHVTYRVSTSALMARRSLDPTSLFCGHYGPFFCKPMCTTCAGCVCPRSIALPSNTAYSAVWRNVSVGGRRWQPRSQHGHV